MKRIIVKTAAIMLILAGVIACGKEKEKEEKFIEIPLDYGLCLCENTLFLGERVYENILMFDQANTIFDEMKNRVPEKEGIKMFVSATVSVPLVPGISATSELYVFTETSDTTYNICNFPTGKITQTIPENGLSIYIAGDVYETCTPHPDRFYYRLTSLKIQQQ
ncbi:MAG: hypothetical protein LBE11_02860 [Prevotellaceae bacterium]|jgi:hypothetical protein|nr:hypothetical protein [Prevotellaceae bacterium]